jgi:hypothetical protein
LFLYPIVRYRKPPYHERLSVIPVLELPDQLLGFVGIQHAQSIKGERCFEQVPQGASQQAMGLVSDKTLFIYPVSYRLGQTVI